MYIRKQEFEEPDHESLFLWGARQTGKSTLLKDRYPKTLLFDLLLSDVFERLQRNPSLLREIVMAETNTDPVIIDEGFSGAGKDLNDSRLFIANRGT